MNLFRRYVQILLPLAILAGIIGFRIFGAATTETLHLKVFDWFQRMEPRVYTPAPVYIVDVDDQTLAKIGQWPWPRTQIGELIAKLHEAGAAAIVMDILFAEADRTSPQNVIRLWPQTAFLESIKANIESLPDHDDLFAQALKEARVVSAFSVGHHPNDFQPQRKSGFAFSGQDPKRFFPNFPGAVVNLEGIQNAAAGNGSFNIVAEPDGIIRRVPLVFRVRDELYPSLVLETLRVAQGASTHIIKSVGGSGEAGFGENTGITSVKTGNLVIPTDAEGRLWLHDTGYVPERFIPAWKVLASEIDRSFFENSIVLIGTSAVGLKDLRATPLNPTAAGVEVHAQLIEQVLLGDFLHRPDWAPGAELIYLTFLGLIMIFMMSYVGALWCAVIGGTFIFLAFGISWIAFTQWHRLLDPLMPSVAVLLIYLSASLVRYLRSESEKREIRGAFSRYMSPHLVKKLADHPEQLQLGGEIRNMSFLFTDIRGFTTISEKLTAHELTTFINKFLTPMSEIILEHQGTIDKYMGDCIMAFWNAPLEDPEHARNACSAALEMRERLGPWNEEMKKTADAKGQSFPPIRIGIGINSGDCCVGNMGSAQRFDYSVLGDEVNLASRLEGITKSYGADIVIGENTREKVSDFAALEIDLIRVKGKNHPVHVYSLLGTEVLERDPQFTALVKSNLEMLAAYRARDWAAAEDKLSGCERSGFLGETLAPYYALYRERIHHYRAAPPGADWDGVTVALTK